VTAALLWATPALAQAPGAEAEPATCESCGAGAAGGTCTAPGAGAAASREISDEEWKEYVRGKLAQGEAEKPEPVDMDPFAFSNYRGRRLEPMGEQTIINGARMKIAQLIVPDDPQTVAQEYFETMDHMGMRPLVGEVPSTRGVRYLSFRPPGSKNLKTITLVPHGKGTIILASVGNPEEMLVKKPELPAGLPVPPNAQAASTIQQVEPGAGSRSAYFVVRQSTVDRVREFYRQQLEQRGFSRVASPGASNTDSFEKGGDMVSVSSSPHTEPGTVAVNIVWMQ
jgi:hypothetical protein